MDVRFDNKVAVVTGSARGIGYAVVDKLLAGGARVAMVDILEERLKQSAEILSKKGLVKIFPQDLTVIKEISTLVTEIRKEMGEIDVLIQPAAYGPQANAENITEDEWDKVFNINVKALFFMMREVVEQSMAPRHRGSIVNFASMAGLIGMRPPLCSAHYSGSKGAVIALSKQGAIEWAPFHVRVNAVAPGGVLTDMNRSIIGNNIDKATALVPLGRLTEPEEVASAVLFLASDLADNITGQIMVIDGGGYASQADPGFLTPEALQAYSRK